MILKVTKDCEVEITVSGLKLHPKYSQGQTLEFPDECVEVVENNCMICEYASIPANARPCLNCKCNQAESCTGNHSEDNFKEHAPEQKQLQKEK